jgi:membrane protein
LSKTSSRLAATRAAGAKRLERLERAADSSRRFGPLLTIYRRIGRHELIDRGAALTYYGVLALVPAVLVVFSVIGLFGSDKTVDQVLSIVHEVGPTNGESVARGPLTALVKHDTQSGTLLGLGLIAILWTASAYVGSFFRASATIWDVEKQRVRRAWPLRFALTLVILLLLALALLLIVLTGHLATSIGKTLGVGQEAIDLFDFLKWPALLLVVTLLVGLLYRVSPRRERSVTKWAILTPGGAVATVSWVLVSVGFEIYANSFATYDSTYGALGTTIAGLIWLWLTNLTLLMGVELDAALELRGGRAGAATPEPTRESRAP